MFEVSVESPLRGPATPYLLQGSAENVHGTIIVFK